MPSPPLSLAVVSVACCVTFLFTSACQGAFGGGISAFHHADYPQAARELRAAAEVGVEAEDVARYHLYAGLTHLALGDAALAVGHLTRARTTLDTDPEYFSTPERARLLSAWQALGRMPGQRLLP
jgi:hypothetical protein